MKATDNKTQIPDFSPFYILAKILSLRLVKNLDYFLKASIFIPKPCMSTKLKKKLPKRLWGEEKNADNPSFLLLPK